MEALFKHFRSPPQSPSGDGVNPRRRRWQAELLFEASKLAPESNGTIDRAKQHRAEAAPGPDGDDNGPGSEPPPHGRFRYVSTFVTSRRRSPAAVGKPSFTYFPVDCLPHDVWRPDEPTDLRDGDLPDATPCERSEDHGPNRRKPRIGAATGYDRIRTERSHHFGGAGPGMDGALVGRLGTRHKHVAVPPSALAHASLKAKDRETTAPMAPMDYPSRKVLLVAFCITQVLRLTGFLFTDSEGLSTYFERLSDSVVQTSSSSLLRKIEVDSDYAPLIEFESADDFFSFFEQSSQVYIKSGVKDLVLIFVDDTFVDVFEIFLEYYGRHRNEDRILCVFTSSRTAQKRVGDIMSGAQALDSGRFINYFTKQGLASGRALLINIGKISRVKQSLQKGKSKIWRNLWPLRIEIMRRVLSGFPQLNIILSDADAIWLQDPSELWSSSGSDLIASRGTYPGRSRCAFAYEEDETTPLSVCLGWSYFRNTEAVRLLLIDLELLLPTLHNDDQLSINCLLHRQYQKLGWFLDSDGSNTQVYRRLGVDFKSIQVTVLPYSKIIRNCEEGFLSTTTVTVAHCHFRRRGIEKRMRISNKNADSKIHTLKELGFAKERNTDLGTGWLASFIQKFPLHIISLPSLCMTLCNPAAGVGGAPDSGKEQVDIVFNFFRLARKLKVIVSFQDASGGGWVTGCGTRGGWPTGLTTHELHGTQTKAIARPEVDRPGAVTAPMAPMDYRSPRKVLLVAFCILQGLRFTGFLSSENLSTYVEQLSDSVVQTSSSSLLRKIEVDSDYAPLIEFESADDFFNFFEQSSQVYIKNGVKNLVLIFVDDTFVDVFEERVGDIMSGEHELASGRALLINIGKISRVKPSLKKGKSKEYRSSEAAIDRSGTAAADASQRRSAFTQLPATQTVPET
ncbi:hypothetical protein THAOC_09411 [Thalassiosira oceanica]|uniref:Nucleotide-diphospho-sugar transferase domain-containing protein n=1 Tax=Thalassiosira oceanica TaxID=159749 RepID=K0TFP2_THAOC|nr:hypothetical protein THAOC_09411 [Thalassiosira oceanica]|eukprot:EJK69342.1 hypothetical protein THAOC_09411 [Thalassiosira oceanica]